MIVHLKRFPTKEHKLRHLPDVGWGTVAGTENPIPIKYEDMLMRRIEHTRCWCLKNDSAHTFEQPIFYDEDDGCRVMLRRITVLPTDDLSCSAIIGPEKDYDSASFFNQYNVQLFDDVTDAFLITDTFEVDNPGPRILYVNRAFENMTGYTLAEVIGKTPRILQGDDTSEEAKQRIREGLNNWSKITQRITNYKKNGEKFEVELNITPSQDTTGWYTSWSSVQVDMTRESYLHSQDMRNLLALNSAEMGTWTWDFETNEIHWDAKMFELYGKNRDSGLSEYSLWADALHPEDKNGAEASVQQAAETGEDWDRTFRIIKANKEIAHIHARAKVFKNPVNNNMMMVGVNWDVSDDVASQKELAHQTSMANINAKLASIGELAAGVAHEINNPLSIINALTDIIEIKTSQGNLSEKQLLGNLQKLRDASGRINKIVSGLKTASYNAQDDNVGFSDIELINELKETLPLVDRLFRKENVRLLYEDLPETAFVISEHSSLQQILMNLLNNAKDAVKDQSDGLIVVSVKNNDDFWRLTVKDNGMGISEENAQRIFEPFMTTKGVGQGTGLGLSICKNLADAMNGNLGFFANEAKGTTFYLDLKKAVSEDTADSPAKYRVLLVEDDHAVADVIAEMLTLLGCDVKIANNGKEGKRLVEEKRQFDIIISDIRMPEMNGPAFVKWLSESDNLNSTALYLISGDMGKLSPEETKLIETHCTGWLPKPVGIEALQKMLANEDA